MGELINGDCDALCESIGITLGKGTMEKGYQCRKEKSSTCSNIIMRTPKFISPCASLGRKAKAFKTIHPVNFGREILIPMQAISVS